METVSARILIITRVALGWLRDESMGSEMQNNKCLLVRARERVFVAKLAINGNSLHQITSQVRMMIQSAAVSNGHSKTERALVTCASLSPDC